MHARTAAAAGLSGALALAAVGGPLAGHAVADPPQTLHLSFSTVPGSFLEFPLPPPETRGQITRATFTERSVEQGSDYPGTSTTTWSCMERAGAEQFRCTGESVFLGTYEGVTAPADVRLTATCTEPSPVFYVCEGRFRLDGRGALEGLTGHATWESSGLFSRTSGSGVLRLHDHR